eukprot:3269036-Alexandrium_andersonii.AAC.1
MSGSFSPGGGSCAPRAWKRPKSGAAQCWRWVPEAVRFVRFRWCPELQLKAFLTAGSEPWDRSLPNEESDFHSRLAT